MPKKSLQEKPKKPLKVGFDLDGVILYNPARIARPILAFVSQVMLHKKKESFYIPRSPLAQAFWYLLHKSSLFPAPGFNDIFRLVRAGKIEAYIVTGRYASLRTDFERWMDKIGAHQYFKEVFYNSRNDQPHVFKAKLIKRLRLDFFVEDNWDIVNLLNEFHEVDDKTRVLWITNILDRTIPYLHKFSSLKKAVAYIESRV